MATKLTDQRTITQAQYLFARALTQILVSVVVLNLFVEWVHAVVIDSFTVSVLTAILLWLMLSGTMRLERRVSACFRQKEGAVFRVMRYLSVWAILFVSKFVILEVVALATAGQAVLGHFLEVVAIVVALMVAEALLNLVYRKLGSSVAAGAGDGAT